MSFVRPVESSDSDKLAAGDLAHAVQPFKGEAGHACDDTVRFVACELTDGEDWRPSFRRGNADP